MRMPARSRQNSVITMARNNAKTRTTAVPGVLADPVGGQPVDVSYENTEAVFRQIPVGTVRSRVFHALRALRRTLAAHDAAA
jgi:hypothetical protein